jgi:hypothetical protein
MGGGRFFEYRGRKSPHIDELFGRVFDPRYLLELTDRNPEAALAWLQLAREMRGGQFLEYFGRDPLHNQKVLERVLDPRYLFGLSERNPEAALAWLQLAREMTDGHYFEHFEEEKWMRLLNSFDFSRLLDQKPTVFAVALSIARNILSPQAIDIILKRLIRPLHRVDGGRSILGTLPIAALNDLKWLANKTNDPVLNAALDSWRTDLTWFR